MSKCGCALMEGRARRLGLVLANKATAPRPPLVNLRPRQVPGTVEASPALRPDFYRGFAQGNNEKMKIEGTRFCDSRPSAEPIACTRRTLEAARNQRPWNLGDAAMYNRMSQPKAGAGKIS